IVRLNTDLANLYYLQYLDDQAIPLFQRALTMAKQLGDTSLLITAELNMAVVEENRKDFEAALVHRKEYERLLKAEWDRDRIWELAEQQKQFAIDTKQQEVDLYVAREQQQQAELAQQRTQRKGLLAVAALLLTLVAVIAYYYRRMQANNRIISAQKEQLNELNLAKNQLFAMVAHDLKSPVLALQRAQRKLSRALGQQDQAQVQSLAVENEHITTNTFRLLNNVLHWAMEQTEQLSFVAAPMPVQQLMAQVAYDYQGLVQTKGLALEQDFGVEAQVEVDANLMKIVLRNLLDNALKFTPPGGNLTLQAVEDGDLVTLSVTDTGVGMTTEQQARLFSITQHEIRQDTEGRKGTGLGMLLCQRLVHRHGGTLAVQSREGHGTRISIQLPIFQGVDAL
ncbi:MAG: HAMP domain-containing sensor histidine kinase, partial [Bacteroidota bacterium]